MDLDICRYFMNRKGKKIPKQRLPDVWGGRFCKAKSTSLSMSGIMSEHSEGIAVHFHINVKPVLSWSPFHLFIYYFSNGKVYSFHWRNFVWPLSKGHGISIICNYNIQFGRINACTVSSCYWHFSHRWEYSKIVLVIF